VFRNLPIWGVNTCMSNNEHRLLAGSQNCTTKKTNKLACFSFIFLLMGIALCSLVSESCGSYRLIRKCLVLLVAVTSFSLAFIAIRQIDKREKSLRGCILSIVVLCISLWLLFTVFMHRRITSASYEMLCGSQMHNLGTSMLAYINENDGRFPSADNWCNLLLEHTKATADDFVCPASFWPSFSYGFNKNLDGLRIGEVPPETVVLFEIEGGRNISGGPELLVDDRHYGNLTNVLFADFHVAFVKKERVKDLKWKVQDK